MAQKTIAFFPEAAFGPALNSVGIAQAVEKLGHKAVFLSDPGFLEVYQGYGFESHPVNLSEPMPPEEMAKFWEDFINGHIPNFRKAPIDQLDNYVKECWEAIVDSAKWAEKDLPGVLAKIAPDVVCVDNVILFPAIKRYGRENGKPWVRIISCSENEIEADDIPPHLSGCGESDSACHAAFRDAIPRGDQADPRGLQRLPRRVRRSGLSARPVFRGLAPHEPAALSGAGEVRSRAEPLDPAKLPVSRGLRARRCALPGAERSRPTTTSPCSTSATARSAPATRTSSSG